MVSYSYGQANGFTDWGDDPSVRAEMSLNHDFTVYEIEDENPI
ncbi:MAG: hypothetical protein PHI41_10450 [Erysipelotrichaceae bacterium]|nr:hypothetical protein [Erysipelotrichaceae bacterium]